MFGVLPIDPGAAVKIGEFATFICVVSACAGVLYLVYRYVMPREDDEAEFAATIFILTVAIGLLVSIIKQAPAISFGLFGAMSIVRFRAQIKRPQRMIFIFMAAAIGVCCGAGEYLTTVLGTLILSVLTIISFSLTPAKVKGKAKSGIAMPALPGVNAAPVLAAGIPVRWGVDFVPLTLGDGCRIRILAIVDEGSREALALVPETSFSGSRVVGELDRLIGERGKPSEIISDTWPQLSSRAVLDWKQWTAIDWLWSQNQGPRGTFAADFAVIVQDRCLGPGYASLISARSGLETWRLQYNQEISLTAVPAIKEERIFEPAGIRLAINALREPTSAIATATAVSEAVTNLATGARVKSAAGH